MAKVKYNPAKKKDPNFKIGEMKEVKGATNIVTALVVEETKNKQQSNLVNKTGETPEEME